MTVTLKHYTPLDICSDAIRQCWQSQDKSDKSSVLVCNHCGHKVGLINTHGVIDIECSQCGSLNTHFEIACGPRDLALIERVGIKNKHASTLEHLSYNFDIEGISRALLQELARHRLASLSVKSTRYTLKELKDEESFFDMTDDNDLVHNDELAQKYIVFTGNKIVDYFSVKALENLRLALRHGISNDKAKYCLPEAYKTQLTWTINARSLQNFLKLRTDKSALWEIRLLANAVFDALPDDHKYLFESFLYKEEQSVESV